MLQDQHTIQRMSTIFLITFLNYDNKELFKFKRKFHYAYEIQEVYETLIWTDLCRQFQRICETQFYAKNV